MVKPDVDCEPRTMTLFKVDRSPASTVPALPSTTRSPTTSCPIDRLATRLAALTDGDPSVKTAWEAIVSTEALLGIALGDPDDNLPMLWRRFARAHRSLVSRPPTDSQRLDAEQVLGNLLASLG